MRTATSCLVLLVILVAEIIKHTGIIYIFILIRLLLIKLQLYTNDVHSTNIYAFKHPMQLSTTHIYPYISDKAKWVIPEF